MRNKSLLSRAVMVAILGFLPIFGAGCLGSGSDDSLSSAEQDVSGPPATVTATASSPTSVTVSWSAVSDAVKYYILQSTNGGPAAYIGSELAPTTTRIVTGLAPGSTYAFQIVAVGADGTESGPSSAASVTLGSSAGAPTNITATPVGSSEIDVAFSTVANARKYYLFQSQSNGPYAYIGTIVDPGNTRAVTGLFASTLYCYKLQTAFLDGSESGLSAPVCANTGGGPVAPTGVTATAVSDTRINVQWNSVTVANKYFVYQSAAGGMAPFAQVGTVFAPTTSFLAVNLVTNTNYCFQVSTVTSDGTESARSSTACATTLSTGGGGFEAVYRFDERTGSIARDSSGHNIDATLSGGAAFSTTDRAQIDDNQSSVNIPASTSAVVRATSSTFNLVGPFSVAFWAKLQAAGDARFLGMRAQGCGALAYEIGQNSGGLYFAGEGSQVIPFGTSIAVGQWAHISVTYSSGSMQTYVNGVATGSGSYIPTNSVQGSLELGHPGGCTGTAINLDQLQIYSRQLAAAEVSVLGTLPPAPTNLTVASVTSVSQTLTWTTVPNATSYILSKGTAAGNEQFYTHIPNTGSYTADHLTPGTQYSWTVRAVVNGLYSNPSNSAVGTTNGPPAAPTNVTATAISSTRINVTWSTVTGAVKYYVFQSTSGGAYTQVGSVVASSSSPSFLAVNLTPSTTYSYKIQAEDSGQITSALSAPASATTPSM